MPAGTNPIFPQAPWSATASLAAVSACTTRGPVVFASLGLTPCFAVQLSQATTNGKRVDKIQVQASSTAIGSSTVAQTVLLWLTDGVTAYLVDEIAVTAVTPSATTPAFNISKSYANLVLPPSYTLWVSTTVATTVSTNALVVTAFGGDY